jgi:hypothetical protein
MAKETKPETPATPGPAPKGNKAQAAFEEYRKRMDAFAARAAGGMSVGQPFMPPHPHGMPASMYPPPPAAMPDPYAPWPAAPQADAGTPKSPDESLFGRIGQMIRLGVEVANVGLAGGLQIIEGLSGQGQRYPAGDPYAAWGCGYPYPAYDRGCECHGGYDSCCHACGAQCACNPSVRNCC